MFYISWVRYLIKNSLDRVFQMAIIFIKNYHTVENTSVKKLKLSNKGFKGVKH